MIPYLVKPYPAQPDYLVSTFGDVFSRDRAIPTKPRGEWRLRNIKGKKLSPSVSGGYLKVYVGGLGTMSVHRLVAEAFIPNPNGHPVINHIDGTRRNNHVLNLEWCTQRQNVEHASRWLRRYPKRKYVTQEQLDIAIAALREGSSVRAASIAAGINNKSLRQLILSGGRRRYGGDLIVPDDLAGTDPLPRLRELTERVRSLG